MTEKPRKIPPLRKKQHSWANTDPSSLAAALFHQEIAKASEEEKSEGEEKGEEEEDKEKRKEEN